MRLWDHELKEWPTDRIGRWVVADGTQTSLEVLARFAELNTFQLPMLLDLQGQLRTQFHLAAGPTVLGLSRRGRVVFLLPLVDWLFTNEADQQRGIEAFLRGIDAEMRRTGA